MTIVRIVLTLVFAWSLLKTGSLALRTDSMDLVLFSAAGIGWTFWVLFTMIVLALVGALV